MELMLGEGGCNLLQLQIKVGTKIFYAHIEIRIDNGDIEGM